MKKDIAVEDIRAVRSRISAKFGHSTKRLIDHYKKMGKKYRSRLRAAGAEHHVN